jgi:ubiquinone/menaquinone biosynthesis methyltransferase
MNDLMSGSLHRVWKDEFVRMACPVAVDGKPARLLDVAGGTGDIAFRLLEELRSGVAGGGDGSEIIVCDINAAMLDVGRDRAEERGYMGEAGHGPALLWTQGDAESLPVPSESVDLYTIAFGIRNVTHVDKAIEEAHRVLKPGGRFMCLEFSKVHPLLAPAYDMYSFNVIPLLGELVAQDRASYQYLVESIRQFPSQDAFKHMIEQAGFSLVSYTNLSGGVCAIHTGFKL